MPESHAADTVNEALEEYARRGVFRGFSRSATKSGKTTFRMRWHYDRMVDCVFDSARMTMRFPALLPDVGEEPDMVKALRAFVRARHQDTLPEHRRIDPERAQTKVVNRGGNLSLSIHALDGDLTYTTRKLINLVHEIFLDFLRDGPYIDYLVETMGLNLDQY